MALGVQAQANGARLRQRAVIVGLLGGGKRGGVRGRRSVGQELARAPPGILKLRPTFRCPQSSAPKPSRSCSRCEGPSPQPAGNLGSAPERPQRSLPSPAPRANPSPESASSQAPPLPSPAPGGPSSSSCTNSCGAPPNPPTLRPVRVGQDRRSLLASTAAVSVEPLFPPQPTSMTPSRGTCRAVRKVKRVDVG